MGATGSGKSISLAALIDHRNSNSGDHIITIQDPIEFIHRHKRSIVNQRGVGVATLTYADALKNTLRQAPDIILIGEICDWETMEHGLAFAETGHFSSFILNANNSNQALDRITNLFSEEHRSQISQSTYGPLYLNGWYRSLKGIGYILAGMRFLFLGIHYMKE